MTNFWKKKKKEAISSFHDSKDTMAKKKIKGRVNVSRYLLARKGLPIMYGV